MTKSPSAPLLKILQQAMRQQNMNTSVLSEKTGIPRRDIKRMLAGHQPLTVDALIQLGEALELTADFLQAQGLQVPSEETMDAAEDVVQLSQPNEGGWTPDPLGNHAEQLLRSGIALGVDMRMIMESTQLQASGVPKHVLQQFTPFLPIDLLAKFHPYQKPQFFPHGIQLRLSFDALYTCLFPWNSIKQIIFYPQPHEPLEEEPEEESEEKPAHPFLRVVK